jgi:hypothetical protein
MCQKSLLEEKVNQFLETCAESCDMQRDIDEFFCDSEVEEYLENGDKPNLFNKVISALGESMYHRGAEAFLELYKISVLDKSKVRAMADRFKDETREAVRSFLKGAYNCVFACESDISIEEFNSNVSALMQWKDYVTDEDVVKWTCIGTESFVDRLRLELESGKYPEEIKKALKAVKPRLQFYRDFSETAYGKLVSAFEKFNLPVLDCIGKN